MTPKDGFYDSKGRLLRELDESDEAAIRAVSEKVARCYSCMIAKNGGEAHLLGSGTLVQAGDCQLIATAKHLFEGVDANELIGAWWNHGDHRIGFKRDAIILHDTLDIAAILLPSNASATAAPLGQLRTEFSLDENEIFVLTGIPQEKLLINEATRTVEIGHWSIGLVALPVAAWPTYPERPLAQHVDLLLNYTKFAIDEQGRAMDQINPHGLSGGGVWSVPARGDSVWKPGDAQFVAIQSSVQSGDWRYVRATLVEHWLRLLIAKCPSVRDEILSQYPRLSV